MVPDVEVRSYYDKAILKQPVWKWYVPAYFFTGGLAAGSAMLAAGARLTGFRRLARQSRFVTLGALGVSTALLVKDLGRPARFYNMLRVLKPTSPMSIGSWVLGAFGTAAAAGTASDVLGVLPGVGGAGAFFLLLDDPEVYGLPPKPASTTRDLPSMWKSAAAAALSLTVGIAAAFVGRRR